MPSLFDRSRETQPILLGLDTPHTRDIGEDVGGLPTYFVTIHEVENAVLQKAGTVAAAAERELAADAFAAEAFADENIPTTLGLRFLLLANAQDRGGSASGVACRIVALATAAGPQDAGRALELGLQAMC